MPVSGTINLDEELRIDRLSWALGISYINTAVCALLSDLRLGPPVITKGVYRVHHVRTAP